MNTEEKNNSPKTEEVKKGGFVAWWKALSIGLKATLIAAASLVVIIPVLLLILLGGKGGNGGTVGVGGGGQKTAYTVTVVTEGGMKMSGLPIYIYEYNNGALGNLVDGGYASTNENGKAVFSLPKNGSYAAKINISIPDGYDAKDFYPLVSKDLEISVSSSIIPESSLVGVTYNLGDVMRDFTVTTTDGKQFTLSEVLKEKDAVLINFWYTTCSWCIEEFPLMQSVYEKYRDDIAIIALDPNQEDALVDIKNFQNTYGLTFDVAKDYTSLSTAFSVTGYPTSVVIDRYGVISLVVPGAITSQRAFEVIFEHFSGDIYEQKLIYDYNDIVPKEKPDVEMPSSDDMSEAFDGGKIDGIEYFPYPYDVSEDEKEYSWPFIIGQIGEGANSQTVIYPSNANKEGSFAQLLIEVPLKAGEALAFDYYSSTELSADILYVVVDGKDIYSISGESTEWGSCYAFVAEEDATYEVGLIYVKDSSDNVGDDTVYLKNLRICDIDEIDNPTYIYRFAATEPDRYGVYGKYVEIFYNEKDGYYHVDSVNGPLLLANLMGYTRFSGESTVYYMSVDYLARAQALYEDKAIGEAEFKVYQQKYDRLIQYCNYASNASVYGVSPVTKELMELLIEISLENGAMEDEKDYRWLEFCCYYDSYGTDKELEDPIKGLSTFSAYTAVASKKGSKDFPNSITYNRLIMPRGLFSKFTPTESGTYLITSTAPSGKDGVYYDCDAWIFVADSFSNATAWYTYSISDRNNIKNLADTSNTYMMVYLEAGRDYYINIAYADVYQEGTIKFRIERIGGEGVYRFSIASPSFYTSLLNTQGELTETISGGIAVEFKDGYWREKRTDGRAGSILYADFTNATGVFNYSIQDMIKRGAFNLSTTDEDEYVKTLMVSNAAYGYYLDLYLKDLWGSEYSAKSEEYKVNEVLAGTYHGKADATGTPTKSENDKYILGLLESMGDNTRYNTKDNFKAFLKIYWGEDYYADYMTQYQVDDVLNGKYHGKGQDYTEAISKYLNKVIKAGYNSELKETISAGDERIGCVMVDAELAELLQIIMYKYSFEGIENSWAKLCYYHQYFCAATPN